MSTTAEQDVKAFAAQYPTGNVRLAVELCETGALSWEAVAGLFAQSLATALQSVRAIAEDVDAAEEAQAAADAAAERRTEQWFEERGGSNYAGSMEEARDRWLDSLND